MIENSQDAEQISNCNENGFSAGPQKVNLYLKNGEAAFKVTCGSWWENIQKQPPEVFFK